MELILDKKHLNLPLYDFVTFKVKGKNRNGYYATIDPKDVKWKAYGGIGGFVENMFISTLEGTGYIEASVGNTRAYCTISVITEYNNFIDRFEKEGATFTPYPGIVTGSFEITRRPRWL